MSKKTAIQEINNKIYQWKMAFAQKVSDVSGEQMPADVTKLSYIDILTAGEENRLSFRDAASVLSQEKIRIGFFSDEARVLLNTPGRRVAESIADTTSSYTNQIFAAQVKAGALIANGPNMRAGAILHDRPFRMTEIFYETKDETSLQLPDLFVLNEYTGSFYTVKAVENIEDNPVLKNRMKELKILSA